MKKGIIFGLLFCFSQQGLSQDSEHCANVIELSKIRSTVVQDQQSVDQHASKFCSQYSSSSGSTDSESYGASYKFLSASFGSSSASVHEVASKYCSSSDSYKASKDAFQQYIESISPGAWGAYQQCVIMSKQDLRFNIDPGNVLPTEFSVSASFVSGVKARKDTILTYTASEDVSCSWNGTESNEVVLQTGSTGFLKCKREDKSRKSYVTLLDSGSGRTKPLTLPWQPYSDEGIPINALDELQVKMREMSSRLSSVDKVSSGNAKDLQGITIAPTVTVYRCPKGTGDFNPGGAWGSYGCQGQISTESQCTNIEYPHVQNRECAKLGVLRLF